MIRIDPESRAVVIEVSNDVMVEVGGYSGGGVERGDARALFLEQAEAETLAKMIDYIVENVRIRAESKEALEAVRPRLDTLFED